MRVFAVGRTVQADSNNIPPAGGPKKEVLAGNRVLFIEPSRVLNQFFVMYRKRYYGKRRPTRLRRVLKRRTFRRGKLSQYRRRKSGYKFNGARKFNGSLPLGRRAMFKLRYVKQGYLAGDNTNFYAASSGYGLNTLVNSILPKTSTADTRADSMLLAQFENYRIKGVKYHLKFVQASQSSLATTQPLVAFFAPYTTDGMGSPGSLGYTDLGYLQQWPGAKWTTVNHGAYGGSWKSLKGYVSMKQLVGSKQVNDVDYAGYNNAGVWASPLKLAQFDFGVMQNNATALVSNTNFSYQLYTTYYVEFFNASSLGVY